MSFWQTPVRDLARQALTRIGQALYRGAVDSAVREALDNYDRDHEDYGFRSKSWTERDLTPIGHDTMLRMARHFWARNPVAKRALEIHRDFVCSEGFAIRATCEDEAKRERVQARIDEHWKDERNKWPERIGQRVMEIAQFGELDLYRFVNPIDGRVRWGFIAPESILAIEADVLDAENLKWIVLREPVEVLDEQGQLVKKDRLRILHRDENPQSETFGQLVGDVVHVSINRMSGATRGLSDLLSVADLLDRLTTLINSESDRAQFLKAFLWDVEVDGDKKAVDARAAQLRKKPPKPGTCRVHNKKEKWNAVTPALQAADMLEFLRFLLMMCLGALGIPVHYFADSENVNRASAEEMADPVYARVRERQNVVKSFLTQVFRFVLEQARAAGPLRDCTDADLEFEVVVTDPDRSEYDKLGAMLLDLVEAFTKATTVGFIDEDEARTIFRQLANTLGVELPDKPAAAAQDAGQGGPEQKAPADEKGWMDRLYSIMRTKPKEKAEKSDAAPIAA